MRVLRFSQRYFRRFCSFYVIAHELIRLTGYNAKDIRTWATLKIDVTICSETLVCVYQSTHHHIPEDGNYHWEFLG